MIVINVLDRPLPHKLEVDFEEQLLNAGLEYRSTLGMHGEVSSGMKPLNPQEMLAHRRHEGNKWLSRAPRWNGVDFPFAAAGQPGSAYELPERVALFLSQKYNAGVPYVCKRATDEILHILGPGEKLADGIIPIRPSVDDPLMYSSEMLHSKGQVVSRGFADHPPLVDPADIAIPVGVDGAPPDFTPKAKSSGLRA